MEHLAKSLGFTLIEVDLGEGLLGVTSRRFSLILLNSVLRDRPLEREFTIAHEMAHHFCDHRGEGYFSSNSKSSVRNAQEWEADQFAWELLSRKYNSLFGKQPPVKRLTAMIENVNIKED